MKLKKSPQRFLAVVLLAALAYSLGWSNLISVREIRINSKDPSIVTRLESRLNQPPTLIMVGEPLARVDKRQIISRLKTFLWVKDVSVSRNILSRVVTITVEPRTPLAKINNPSDPSQNSYLAADLSLFDAKDSGSSIVGGSGGDQLPLLTISSPERATLGDVKLLIEQLSSASLRLVAIKATDRQLLATTLNFNGRKVDVSWGSVKDLALKIEIVNRLFAMPENSKIKSIDVTDPTAPIVR